MSDNLVGVDLGGTRIRAILRCDDGRILGRAASLTGAEEGPEAVLRRIHATIEEAVGDHDWGGIAGVGIGAPGPLDPFRGVVLQAPNLPGWHNVPLRDIVADAFDKPTELGNDANLAALGEHEFGAGRGVDDMVYVTISTGIGGGIISNGSLLLGCQGLAGEVGHHTIVVDGPLCGCGNRGCLEALASGTAIGRMGREAAARGQGDVLLRLANDRPEGITSRVVADAARTGDATAIEIIRRAAVYIGIGLANLVSILNPELFVLGGGVTQIGDLLFDTIRETLAQTAMSSMRGVRVVPATLGDDVVLMGAIALIQSSLGDAL